MKLLPFDSRMGLDVTADVERNGSILSFTFAIEGDTKDVVIPPPAPPERADGLWQATCFEAFVSVGKTSYIELNFAPSGQWAAYRFTNYRQGMSELDMAPPEIRFADDRLLGTIDLPIEPGARMNLAAVIEHRSGIRSYWALAHPTGSRPDFHAAACFTGRLA
jgi:hypothetical protein